MEGFYREAQVGVLAPNEVAITDSEQEIDV